AQMGGSHHDPCGLSSAKQSGHTLFLGKGDAKGQGLRVGSSALQIQGLAQIFPLIIQAANPPDIGKNPAVLFTDNSESGDLRKWDQVRGSMVV
ncbi:MAG TPA: hypothetical protein VFR76_00190, partial [Verrucomicrobiae bacterium]|nr:hypothetical protein [Verrucomicrobiae bacterium]